MRAAVSAVFVMSPKTMFICAHTGNVRGSLARAAHAHEVALRNACTQRAACQRARDRAVRERRGGRERVDSDVSESDKDEERSNAAPHDEGRIRPSRIRPGIARELFSDSSLLSHLQLWTYVILGNTAPTKTIIHYTAAHQPRAARRSLARARTRPRAHTPAAPPPLCED